MGPNCQLKKKYHQVYKGDHGNMTLQKKEGMGVLMTLYVKKEKITCMAYWMNDASMLLLISVTRSSRWNTESSVMTLSLVVVISPIVFSN